MVVRAEALAIQEYYCTSTSFLHRLGTGSFLLWFSGNPDPWWLASTEGGGEVGVWGGSVDDILDHTVDPPGCRCQYLVAGGGPCAGRVV